jgi:hypothetical protein
MANPQNTVNPQYNANPQNTANPQNPQYAANPQYNVNMQNAQYSVNGAPADDKKDDDPMTSGKAGIGVGIVCVVIVILCGSFRIRILSWGLVLFLLGGLALSGSAIKGGVKEKKGLAVVLGIIGMIINVAASGYYIWSIIYTIGSKLR